MPESSPPTFRLQSGQTPEQDRQGYVSAGPQADRTHTATVCFSGNWSVDTIADTEPSLKRFIAELKHTQSATARMASAVPTPSPVVQLDLSGISKLDTSGAWVLERCRRLLPAAEYANVPQQLAPLLTVIQKAPDSAPQPQAGYSFLTLCNAIGKTIVEEGRLAVGMLSFFGQFIVHLFQAITNPARIRWVSFFYHMETVGLQGVPIVALISFLIGMVIAYMGAQQLEQFGAQIFVIQLIEVSIMRELGILLTAIVVAGRSGSAFTAQIGAMVANEEVYAMRVMGLDPMDVVVLPRIMALVIMLPILGFISDIMGLLGGCLMVWTTLDIDVAGFFMRYKETADLWHFYTGLIKAPFFAVVIGTIGCFQGLRATGSADSVGRLTTQSVVESIFSVIVLDAAFAIFYATIGI